MRPASDKPKPASTHVSFCNANHERPICPNSPIPPLPPTSAPFHDKDRAQRPINHSFPDTTRVISDNTQAPAPTHAPPRCIHLAPSSARRATSPVTQAKHSVTHPNNPARRPKHPASHPHHPTSAPKNKKGRTATGSSPAAMRPLPSGSFKRQPADVTSRSPAPPCRANRAPMPWRSSSSPEPLPSTFSRA